MGMRVLARAVAGLLAVTSLLPVWAGIASLATAAGLSAAFWALLFLFPD